jgi:hypothetical protein
MSDLSDVEQAVVDTVTRLLYPAGTSSGSIIGTDCRIYRGWPNSATLNSDLSAGVINVTVVSDNEHGRLTTRYLDDWQVVAISPTLIATCIGNSIAISGTPSVGTVVGALVDGVPYVYRVASGDTTAQIAANLSQIIQVERPATLSAATVTVPAAFRVAARVVVDANGTYEARRQEKDIKVILWCPSPATRDSIATAIDLAISQLSFLETADGSSARIRYKNSATYDQSQNALLYRRDLEYNIEYPTIVSLGLPSMIFGGAGVNEQSTFG